MHEIINLDESKFGKTVFIFEDTGDLVNYKGGHTKLQKVLRGVSNMKNFHPDQVPSYRFFQIKKSITKMANDQQMCTLQFIDIAADIFYDDIKA